MKTWLKSTLSILLGIMILVTGSGVSLAKMVCLKSGYTQITLNEPDDCCQHEHNYAPVTIEEKCCDISSLSIELYQYLNSATQSIEKTLSIVEVASPSTITFASYSNVITTHFREYCDPPESSIPPIRIFSKSFLI